MNANNAVSRSRRMVTPDGRNAAETASAKRSSPLPQPSRPFVLINMAMTADGKIATANRAISTFGSRRDHDNLMKLRTTADAVMSGARTVNSGKITLGPGGPRYRRLRRRRGLTEYPLRIIVSGSGSIEANAEVFKHRFSPVIILTTRRIPSAKVRQLRSLAAHVKICGVREVNWGMAMRWLARKWGVRRLLCEGGGHLNDAMFRAGLVDELHLTVCPKIFGGRTAPTIAEGTGVPTLAAATKLRLHSRRRHGDELFLVYVRHKTARRPERPAAVSSGR